MYLHDDLHFQISNFTRTVHTNRHTRALMEASSHSRKVSPQQTHEGICLRPSHWKLFLKSSLFFFEQVAFFFVKTKGPMSETVPQDDIGRTKKKRKKNGGSRIRTQISGARKRRHNHYTIPATRCSLPTYIYSHRSESPKNEGVTLPSCPLHSFRNVTLALYAPSVTQTSCPPPTVFAVTK